MLKEISIRSLASDVAYQRGLFYHANHAVKSLAHMHAVPNAYRATVVGQQEYNVMVWLTADGSAIDKFYCPCPAATAYLGICKHVVAVAKAIQTEQMAKTSAGSNLRKNLMGAKLLQLFAEAKQSLPQLAAGQPMYLEPNLVEEEDYRRTLRWLEFRIGNADRLYVVKDLPALLKSAEDGQEIVFGKAFTFEPRAISWGDERSAKLWAILQDVYAEERSYSNWRGGYSGWRTELYMEKKRLYLSTVLIERFFAAVSDGDDFLCSTEDKNSQVAVRVSQEKPKISVNVADLGKKGARISLDADSIEIVSDHYVRQNDKFFAVSDEFISAVKPLLESFVDTKSITLDRDDMGVFFGDVLPQIERVAQVDVADSFQEKFVMEPLTAEFYFDYHGDGIEVRPSFRYGDVSYNPLRTPDPPLKKGKIIVRETDREREVLNLFETYGFHKDKGLFIQTDEERSYDFLTEALPSLTDNADIFYSDSFQKKPVRRMDKVTAGISVNDDNLLELTFSTDDVDMEELFDILNSYHRKKRYHRLKDGSFITLEEGQLSALSELVENTGLKKGKLGDDMTVRLPLAQAMYLDSLAKEEESLHLERSKKFRSIVRDIRHPEDAEVEVPQTLRKVLRDYQRVGFRWLITLSQYGLGGILADDMGLGKTLQVIAFLLAKRGEVAHPALVVAPTSLMYNWLDEIERFAPELKAAVVAGNKEARQSSLADIPADTDVLITTYNMLKRDIDLYETKEFSYCFLDEAQHIKNPATQNAKSVKRLSTRGYFALTGTPIENTLTELWSIFDYLMPGYLGSHVKFKQRYESPIVKGEDEHAAKDLKRHVMPFILRRMKKDVLKELPDKVENRMLNEMTDKQAKVYKAYFIQGQKEFAAELKAHGFGESRIKILAILTRLRQIACDPSLFLEDYDGGSGKLDMLEEVVGEAVAGGHRILIFSQFTTMLEHISLRLQKMGLRYYYLDGQTPPKERLRLVKEFNVGSVPVFLISLKAGGTGLNLTGADMVIHFDPWWNPAVEDQATDRAYRLGQEKNVQVLKFITKDTIEEKIYKLQQRKKSLIDQMIQPGENFLSKLTEDEIRDLFQG